MIFFSHDTYNIIMFDLLITLIIILLIVFAIIMAIDALDGRKPGQPTQGPRRRRQGDVPSSEDINELRNLAQSSRMPMDTQRALEEVADLCERVYEGDADADPAMINELIGLVASNQGIQMDTSSNVQYNCSVLIAKLRERL